MRNNNYNNRSNNNNNNNNSTYNSKFDWVFLYPVNTLCIWLGYSKRFQ